MVSVDKASISSAGRLGSNSGRVILVTKRKKILVAIFSYVWCNRVTAWTGWAGVIIPWTDEMASLIRSFYLRVAGRKIV